RWWRCHVPEIAGVWPDIRPDSPNHLQPPPKRSQTAGFDCTGGKSYRNQDSWLPESSMAGFGILAAALFISIIMSIRCLRRLPRRSALLPCFLHSHCGLKGPWEWHIRQCPTCCARAPDNRNDNPGSVLRPKAESTKYGLDRDTGISPIRDDIF